MMFFLPAVGCTGGGDDDDTADPRTRYPTATWSQKTTPAGSTLARADADRAGHTAVVHNARMYIFAGKDETGLHNSLHVYDFFANTWQELAPGGTVPDARWRHGAAVINGKMYVIGGEGAAGALADVWEYDIAGNAWTRKSDAPFSRAGHAVSVSGNMIYVFCGKDETGTAIADMWEYDPVGDSWRQLLDKDAPPSPRDGARASFFETIYLHGGDDGAGIWDNYLYKFDFATWSWNTRTRYAEGRAYHASCFADARLYVFGGKLANGAFTNDLWEYDPYHYPNEYATETTERTYLIHEDDPARDPSPRAYATGVAYDGKFYVYGGIDSAGNYLDELWECGLGFVMK